MRRTHWPTLEGHSSIEVEEKHADGQENRWMRKRTRRMPWSQATALYLGSDNHCWVRVHEPYSDWLVYTSRMPEKLRVHVSI